jgi:hypothetical protein
MSGPFVNPFPDEASEPIARCIWLEITSVNRGEVRTIRAHCHACHWHGEHDWTADTWSGAKLEAELHARECAVLSAERAICFYLERVMRGIEVDGSPCQEAARDALSQVHHHIEERTYNEAD